MRQLRRTMGDEWDLAWRAEAQAAFEAKGYDAAGLVRSLTVSDASQALKNSWLSLEPYLCARRLVQ